VCCVTGPMMEMCATASACTGAALACTASTDCANGQVCCGSKLGMTGAASSCQATCSDVRLCVTSMDCPTGEHCMRSASGVHICQGAADAGGGG
jgi:hypothetical protein